MRRAFGLLAFLAFVATSPGLSGLELAAHLSGRPDRTHPRQLHVEPAGSPSHTDHCQLGLVAHEGKIPAAATVRCGSDWERTTPTLPIHLLAPELHRRAAAFPRAPPV